VAAGKVISIRCSGPRIAESAKAARPKSGTRQRDSIFQVNIERHHVVSRNGSIGGFVTCANRCCSNPTKFSEPEETRRSVISMLQSASLPGQRGKESLELIFRPAGSAGDALWLIDGTGGAVTDAVSILAESRCATAGSRGA